MSTTLQSQRLWFMKIFGLFFAMTVFYKSYALFVASVLLAIHVQASLLQTFLSSRTLTDRSIVGTSGQPVRILCLGDSITWGFQSTDGNGYRYALRGKLVEDGNAVNMIGVTRHGNMSDNWNSGFPEFRIDQVFDLPDVGLDELPNVVLLMLGTNDMIQNFYLDLAPNRLAALILKIFSAVPHVTVIVGTLVPNKDIFVEANIFAYNAALPGLVAGIAAKDYKVSLIDFHSSWFNVSSDICRDKTHPTDEGYLKMARIWYAGIGTAARAGNISAPADVANVNDYLAGNDSTPAAATAMNGVCSTTPGQTVPTAMSQDSAPLALSFASGSTASSSSAAPSSTGASGTSTSGSGSGSGSSPSSSSAAAPSGTGKASKGSRSDVHVSALLGFFVAAVSLAC